MSQKKPTTNQQLEEMREMIAGLQEKEPGHIISVDRALQHRVTTLMLMLYGATAKFGIGSTNAGAENGVIVTAQVPVLQVPANQELQWEVSENGKSVMLYIVLNEDVQVEDRSDNAETSPAVEDTAVGEVGATEETPPPTSNFEPLSIDEFEDEIEVGLGD